MAKAKYRCNSYPVLKHGGNMIRLIYYVEIKDMLIDPQINNKGQNNFIWRRLKCFLRKHLVWNIYGFSNSMLKDRIEALLHSGFRMVFPISLLRCQRAY